MSADSEERTLEDWHLVELPDSWLVAGAIAQTVWNHRHGFAPDFGVSDIDLIYYDARDLSEEAEARNSRRINQLFRSLPVRFDVKNEARVHLWYEAKFGHPIDPYESSSEAIATFPTTSTAVGIRPSESGLQIIAPFGLDDLIGLVVKPNKAQITQSVYEAKIERWRPLWPKLIIRDWSDSCQLRRR